MPMTTCPSCDKNVSAAAFDCPHCGHPIRKPKRGFFGWIFKWTFILFNVLMLLWLVSYFSEIAKLSSSVGEIEQAGVAVGATIGTGMLITIWALGDVILGLATILTRPTK